MHNHDLFLFFYSSNNTMHLLNCSSTVICCTIFLILSLHQTQLLADSKNGNDDDKPKCRRARMKISVEYPSSSDGLKCNPIQTAVNYCTGSCKSYMTAHVVPPYVKQECNCCAGQTIKIKKRTLTFNCTDTSDIRIPSKSQLVRRVVFFPYIVNCSCVTCEHFKHPPTQILG